MKKIGKLISACGLSAVILMSCASIKRSDGTRGILQGMMYDYDNRPICGYIVSVDGKQKTVSDINGRFTISGISYGPHLLSGYGREFGSYSEDIEFNDKTQIVYIRIPSDESLFVALDAQIDDMDFIGAHTTLAQISEEGKKHKKYELYDAIVEGRTSAADEGDSKLIRLLSFWEESAQ